MTNILSDLTLATGYNTEVVTKLNAAMDRLGISEAERLQYVSKMMASPDSALSMYLVKAGRRTLFQRANSRDMSRENLYVPINVDAAGREKFREFYGQFNLTYATYGYHDHGRAAARRFIEFHQQLSQLQSQVRDGDVIMDVGGNFVSHLVKGCYNLYQGVSVTVHSACPNLGLRDSMRLGVRRGILRSLLSSSNDVLLKGRIREYFSSTDEGRYACTRTAQECTCRCDVGLCLHSSYDIGMDGLIEIMKKKKMRLMVGTFIWDEVLRRRGSGLIEKMDMWYSFEGDKVYMGFRDSSVYEYVHSYRLLESMTHNAVYSGESGSYVYMVRSVGSVMYFDLRYVPNVVQCLEPSVAQGFYRNDEAYVYYELSTYGWNGRGRQGDAINYVPVKMLVEKKMLDMFLSWVGLLRGDDLNRRKLFGYIRGLRESFRINGHNINPEKKIYCLEVTQLVDFVWLYAYRERYIRSLTMQDFIRGQEIRRVTAGKGVSGAFWGAYYISLLVASRSCDAFMAGIFDSFGVCPLPCGYDEVDGLYKRSISLQRTVVESVGELVLFDDDVYHDAVEDVVDSGVDMGVLDVVSSSGSVGNSDQSDVSSEVATSVVRVRRRRRPRAVRTSSVSKNVTVGGVDTCVYTDKQNCGFDVMGPDVSTKVFGVSLENRQYFNDVEEQSVLASIGEAVRVYRAMHAAVEPSVMTTMGRAMGRDPPLVTTCNKNYNELLIENGKIVWRKFPSSTTYMGGVDMTTMKMVRLDDLPMGRFHLFVTEDTEVMISEEIANSLSELLRIGIKRRKRFFVLEEGIFGCGKTSELVADAGMYDLILCSTKNTRDEIAEKMCAKFEGYDVNRVRTFMSYLMNPDVTADVVRMDEVLLEMAGVYWGCVLFSCATKVFGYGDRRQIVWIDRLKKFAVNYSAYYLWNRVFFNGRTRRSPCDVAYSAKPIYGDTTCTTNARVRSMRVRHVRSEKDVLGALRSFGECDCAVGTCNRKYAVLTFYRRDRHFLSTSGCLRASMRSRTRFLTVHQSQGSTFCKVLICRLNPIAKSCENDQAQVIVSWSRHTRSALYVTRGDARIKDGVEKFFDVSNGVSDDELRTMLVGSDHLTRVRVT